MKEYIKQFYNEGLATTFYLKPKKYIAKKIKNKKIESLLITILEIFYTLLVISFAVLYLYYKLK